MSIEATFVKCTILKATKCTSPEHEFRRSLPVLFVVCGDALRSRLWLYCYQQFPILGRECLLLLQFSA